MFSDIVGFTSMAEALDPEALIEARGGAPSARWAKSRTSPGQRRARVAEDSQQPALSLQPRVAAHKAEHALFREASANVQRKLSRPPARPPQILAEYLEAMSTCIERRCRARAPGVFGVPRTRKRSAPALPSAMPAVTCIEPQAAQCAAALVRLRTLAVPSTHTRMRACAHARAP